MEGVDTDREVNAIRIGGTEYLLTVTAGGAVHLTRETGEGETGQSAVPGQYLAPGHGQLAMPLCGYGQAALARPRWEAVTLCGREWLTMAGISLWDGFGEAGAAAPSCRSCLALMDKLFPAPELDDWFDLAVQAIAGTVAEHRYAEMRDVPGDQQAALRKQVRSAVRKCTGHPSRPSPTGACSCSSASPSTSRTPPNGNAGSPGPSAAPSSGSPPGPCRRPGGCPGIRARPGDSLMRRCRAGRLRCGGDGE